MANWIDGIFSKKISKEAEQTDAQQEFQKKVKASSWLKETMGVSEEELAKEAQAKLEVDIALREGFLKTAAYEPFQTMDVTIDHDFARDAAILSDYQLSEWLAEYRARAEGVPFPENASELKEKAKKDVASDRKGCEKELIKLVGQNTLLDWQKNFKKFTDEGTPKQPEAKELYQPKLKDVNDDLSKGGNIDAYALTDEQHEKTMKGVGREQHERTDVTEQAGETKNESLGKVSSFVKEAIHTELYDIFEEVKKEKPEVYQYLHDKYYEHLKPWIENAEKEKSSKESSLKTASLVRDPEREIKLGTVVRLARTLMTKEGFLLPAGSAWEVTAIDGFHYTISANGQSHTISSHDTPKFDTIKKNASVTDYSRGKDWRVTYYDKDDKVISSHVIKDRTEHEAEKEATGDMPSECEDWSMVPVGSKKNAYKKEVGATAGWDVYLNGKKIDTVFYVPTASAEEVKKGLVEHDNYDPSITVKKSASQEIESHASHEQVLIKIAEIESPWKVVEKDGQQVIARVESEQANTKESEETSTENIQK